MDQIVAPSTNSGPTRYNHGRLLERSFSDVWGGSPGKAGGPQGRGTDSDTLRPVQSMMCVTCQALLQGISATLMSRLFTGGGSVQ